MGRGRQIVLAVFLAVVMVLSVVGIMAAFHDWNGYHWASDELSPTVKDKTSSPLYDVGSGIAEWASLSTPIQPVLTTAKKGQITVSKAGSRQWLGLARIFLDDGHIIKGEVKLNTQLLLTFGAAAADHVLCQELGHVLGLNHNQTALDTCMNDIVALGSTTSPNQHDEDELNVLYGHEDDVGGGGPGNGNGNGRDSGKPQDGWITVHEFPIP